MVRFLCLWLLLLMPFPVFGEEKITKHDSKEILSYLASDKLGGRGTGQVGNLKAARFIANKFNQYGLEPIDRSVFEEPAPPISPFLMQPLDGRGYFQNFNYSYTTRGGLFRTNTTHIKTRNVVGMIKGKTDKCILFGAHFDHLGTKDGKIYNGADDNASGTTALLELAEAFGLPFAQPEYTLIFAAFGAEEVGLVGSRYYVNHPMMPLKDHVLMINMDMVGRLGSKSGEPSVGTPILSLQSGNLSKKTKDLIHKTDDSYPFSFKLTPAGWRSDHAHFNSKGVPVLFFHTGSHPQYHQPTDDEHLINYSGLVQITNFIFELTNKFME